MKLTSKIKASVCVRNALTKILVLFIFCIILLTHYAHTHLPLF